MADITETSTTNVAFDHASADGFLLKEGLDLIYDFKAIKSQMLRDAIRAMIKAVAKDGTNPGTP